jgi:tripartite-type tricarboxylate transporter receptor subunit TctC
MHIMIQRAIAAAAALLLFCGPLTAQTFPSRPIRIITANSAGGTSDIFMRALGDEFQKRNGQPLIIDNRSGGGMNIAGRACADAPNDGYTICMLPNETLTLNEFTFKSISYRPEKFMPITNCFINTQALVVSADLGVETLDALEALSKQRPGTLSYSALAIPMQITMENWKKGSGADIVEVPARGGQDIVTGLMTGTAPIAVVGLPNFLEYIRSGTVKALAVDGDARSRLLPNTPTFEELGFPNLAPVYFGLVAPGGTPPAIIEALYQKVHEIGTDPTFRQKRLLDLGLVPVFDQPVDFSVYLARQREGARKLVLESGYKRR